MKQIREKQFRAAVEKTVIRHGMIRQGDKILLAVSGGPDSMALSRVLLAMTGSMGLSFGIAHINHRLRGGDADHDENFVRTFAKRHGIPFHGLGADVKDYAKQQKMSVEETGRIVRYDFFRKTAAENRYDKIATGHTKDDNAEQVLIGLLRGSGTKGLSGIPPVREDIFIRPLIDLSKQQILDYLTKIGQDYCMDETNADRTYLRNRIRHDLIPLLSEKYNPSIVETLDRLSQILRSEDDYLERHAMEKYSLFAASKGNTTVEIQTHLLSGLHPAIRARVIRQCILTVKSDLKKVSLIHLSDIEEMIRHAETGKHIDLPDRIRVFKGKNVIRFTKEDLPLRLLGAKEKARRIRNAKQARKKG